MGCVRGSLSCEDASAGVATHAPSASSASIGAAGASPGCEGRWRSSLGRRCVPRERVAVRVDDGDSDGVSTRSLSMGQLLAVFYYLPASSSGQIFFPAILPVDRKVAYIASVSRGAVPVARASSSSPSRGVSGTINPLFRPVS